MKRPLRLVQLALMSAPAACLFAACSEQVSGTSSSDTSASSSTVTASATGSTSASSSGSGVGGGYAGDAGCYGAPALWATLTEGPVPCGVNSDCCVIVNTCLSHAQIVGKDHKDDAAEAWPYCNVDCNDCTAPAVDVACIAGECVGRLLTDLPPHAPETMAHCGSEEKSLDFKGPKGDHFECGG